MVGGDDIVVGIADEGVYCMVPPPQRRRRNGFLSQIKVVDEALLKKRPQSVFVRLLTFSRKGIDL